MSAKEALFKMSKTVRAVLERAGIDFQVVPIPKRVNATGNSNFGSSLIDSSVNWLRVPMYNSIYSTLSKDFGREFFKGKVAIEIGGSEGTIAKMLKSFGATIQVAPDYPRVDIENLPYEQGSCDIIILDQIFEHLRHPWTATEQVRRVLKKSGLCICTSVFIYPIHHGANYSDYYRFSPDGFRAIFEGFKIISSEGWGNAEVLRLVYDHSDRGPEGTSPLTKPEAERLGIYNYTDAVNYLMTWCIAQNQAVDSAEVVAHDGRSP